MCHEVIHSDILEYETYEKEVILIFGLLIGFGVTYLLWHCHSQSSGLSLDLFGRKI